MSARCRSLVIAGLTLAAVGIGIGPSPAQAQTLPAEPPVSVQPELCFTASNSCPDTVPVAVTVVNRTNRELTSKLTISSDVFSSGQLDYTIPASVPAHSSRRFFLYENGRGYDDMSAADYLHVDGFGLRDVHVVRSRYYSAAADITGSVQSRITLVSKSPGLLVPYRFAERVKAAEQAHNNRPSLSYFDGYVKPDYVPDSAIGFSGAGILVVGAEGKTLSTSQWGAIHQWVAGGGSLILLGNADFDNPAVAELLPVTPVPATAYSYPKNFVRDLLVSVFQISEENWLPVYGSLDSVPDAKYRRTGWLKPGAERLDFVSTGQNVPSPLARWQVGAGTVLFVGIDPTEMAFRQWSGFSSLWQDLAIIARPGLPEETLRLLGSSSGYDENNRWQYANSPGADRSDDPFQFKLPPVQRVLYLYLGFFILAIPVSFVVLRRMRKPNLAWVTGPVLSVVFAGALSVFAAPLYSAKMSRRTAGIVVLSYLDPTARFQGVTELFLPQKGSYDLAVKGGEIMDSRVYDASLANDSNLRLLKLGDTLHTPGYRVSSLSFRRLGYSQIVDMGGGVTVTEAYCTSDGLLRATIVNRTPYTLNKAELLLPYGDGEGRFRFALDNISPGSHVVMARRVHWSNDGLRQRLRLANHVEKLKALSAPILMANLPGDSFGPQCGQPVDSWDAVTLIASLPPIACREGGR